MMDLSLLHELFDVDKESGVNALVRAAANVSYSLPALVVSVAEKEGYTLGSGSLDLLRRTRSRIADYAELYDRLVAVANVRQLKGMELAALYPSGVLRPFGDLDLVSDTPDELWRVATEIATHRPVKTVDLTLFGGPPSHFFMCLEWESDDEVLDGPMGVDLCTVAYSERSRTLPVRSGVPENTWIKNFLAVAEERFQRPFHARDVLDVLVLLASAPECQDLVSAAQTWQLAPEGAELLGYARRFSDLGSLEGAYARLREHAIEEVARRAALSPRPAEETSDVRLRMERGEAVHGFPLGEPRVIAERRHLELQEFDGGVIAHTPLGDYLLVAGGLVDPNLYELALDLVAKRSG